MQELINVLVLIIRLVFSHRQTDSRKAFC